MGNVQGWTTAQEDAEPTTEYQDPLGPHPVDPFGDGADNKHPLLASASTPEIDGRRWKTFTRAQASQSFTMLGRRPRKNPATGTLSKTFYDGSERASSFWLRGSGSFAAAARGRAQTQGTPGAVWSEGGRSASAPLSPSWMRARDIDLHTPGGSSGLRSSSMSGFDLSDVHRSMVAYEENKGLDRGTGWFQTCLITLTSLLGIGVLGLPYVFAKLGWGVATAVLGLCAVGCVYSGLLINRLYLKVGSPRVYADLGFAAYGECGRWAVTIIGYTYIAGTIISLHLTAAISLQQVLKGIGVHVLDTEHALPLGTAPCELVCSAIVGAIMICIMQQRALEEMAWTAIVGVISIGIPLLIVVWRLLEEPYNGSTVGNGTAAFDRKIVVVNHDIHEIEGVCAAMNVIFAYAGQVIFVELMHEMKDPEDFPKAVWSSTGTMISVYLLISFVGYFCVGSTVESPITSSLPNDHGQNATYLVIVNCSLFIHVIMGYAINANVMNTALLARFAPSAYGSNTADAKFKWFLTTLGTLCVSMVVSNAVPFLSDMMGFVGASCGVATTYIFPCLFALKLLDDSSGAERCLQMSLIVIASCVAAAGVQASIMDMIKNASNGAPPFSC